MEHSDLHFRVVERNLVPELPKYICVAKQEMEHAWLTCVPKPKGMSLLCFMLAVLMVLDWTEVDIQHVVRTIVAQMSSRILIGLPTCRSPRWLDLALSFPADVNTTAFTLRASPPWLHPIVARLIPARYRMKRKIDLAKKMMKPLIDKWSGEKGKGKHEKDCTLLDWMMNNGDEKETRLGEMATRQCLLTLASIHTTSMATAHALFDLCSHPEWFSILEGEIDNTLKDLGPLDTEEGAREWLSRLEKMDSFLVESQRLHPPILRMWHILYQGRSF